MDDADVTQNRLDKEFEMQMKYFRSKAFELANGRCFNCGSIVPPGHKFCDADCRDDYEKRLDK